LSSVILATTQEQREKLAKEMKEVGKIVLDVSGLGEVELGHDLLAIEYETKTKNVREYIPNVIEPSFVSEEYSLLSVSIPFGLGQSREATKLVA
jgi:glycyl-tRNA synthetase